MSMEFLFEPGSRSGNGCNGLRKLEQEYQKDDD